MVREARSGSSDTSRLCSSRCLCEDHAQCLMIIFNLGTAIAFTLEKKAGALGTLAFSIRLEGKLFMGDLNFLMGSQGLRFRSLL